MADLRFDNRVAIITGAGNGLGRCHALLFASRGAKVVVNDLGGSAQGAGKSSAAADKVVEEIKAAGGQAVANYDSVEDGAKIVQCALDTFGGLDIVVNNAGILRDTSFQKLTQEDWDLIYRVHLLGSFRVTHAAWNHMRDKSYGRIVFTTSAAGIYGNFGQANYAAAKLALVGLSNTLAIEGKKKNVHANTIAPIAGSRMTETVLPKELIDALKPEFVSPLVAYLANETCEETGGLFEVGGGFIAKLRWERSAGHTFKLARTLTPEAVAANWGDIAGFEKTTHPTDLTQSMQPILENLGTAKTKGGNEHIDLDLALGYVFPEAKSSYDERDVSLYALGVGAAQNPLDTKELQTVYELHGDGMRVLPTFGVTPALNVLMKMARDGKQAPGLNYGFERVLHGEQYTEIKRPLPAKATLTHKTRIKDIFDKGKNALVITETRSYDEDGEELIVNELTTVVRGAGGWGGERGPSAEVNVPPNRAPDAVITEKIAENQALLYRLSGDWNPLHADPTFATAFGFKQPILHGLCTFGIAARHVIKAFSENDPRLFKSIKVRFADSVFPGETLKTEMWKESDTRIVFRCRVEGREKDVISSAAVELYKEIPTKIEAAATVAVPQAIGSAATLQSVSASAMIFEAIKTHIEGHPELVGKVATTFQFLLTDPASAYLLDVKNGKGAVTTGKADKADCTLELTDSDFVGMATGQLNAQKLYFAGKMKISGNVMASQKLEFLKEIKPSAPKVVLTNAPPTGAFKAVHVFAGIRHHLETHPELMAKVATVFQWKLTSPDSAWILDVKNGKGKCEEGMADKADVTLELTDADFLDMSSGKADAQKLYFGGKLKISGNVMASQKLEFLKQIDKEAAKAAAAKVSTGPVGAIPPTQPQSAPKASRTPAIFAALGERVTKDPKLVKEVGAVVQFDVAGAKWTVDLKNGAGAVREGSDTNAAAKLTLDDEDLLGIVQGTSSAPDLYMRGKLRVDGDVRVAQKLGFLNKLV